MLEIHWSSRVILACRKQLEKSSDNGKEKPLDFVWRTRVRNPRKVRKAFSTIFDKKKKSVTPFTSFLVS